MPLKPIAEDATDRERMRSIQKLIKIHDRRLYVYLAFRGGEMRFDSSKDCMWVNSKFIGADDPGVSSYSSSSTEVLGCWLAILVGSGLQVQGGTEHDA